jgi:gluconate 5-dehydrogenase
VAFDVADADAVDGAVSRLLSDGRPIDILVNNAGIQIRAPLLEMSPENWRKVVDINLTSAFLVARAVVPGMIARKAGKIVNICSIGSELARPTTGPYTAAKGGLKMLTRVMCVEWARENLQINGLAPGYIMTEMTGPLAKDPKFDSWVKGRTPAGRWGSVDDLVGTCVFLSSAAADFVNGQMLFVDGGWVATA